MMLTYVPDEEKKQEIMDEMKSMVNRELLENLFRVLLRDKNAKLADGITDKYLDTWARNKYEFFIAFGHKLAISEKFKQPESNSKVREKIIDLYNNFPVYAPVIKLFSVDDFLSNTCPGNEFLETYCDIYKPGQKLTKFLSKYFQDNKFDIEVSKILQSRTEDSVIEISIDPVAYMCCSYNKNKWGSCYDIAAYNDIYRDSFNKAALCFILDDTTVMLITKTNHNCHFDDFDLDFDMPSVKTRSFFCVEKHSLNGTMFYGQGNPSTQVYNKWTEFVMKYIYDNCKVFNSVVEWDYGRSTFHHLENESRYTRLSIGRNMVRRKYSVAYVYGLTDGERKEDRFLEGKQ